MEMKSVPLDGKKRAHAPDAREAMAKAAMHMNMAPTTPRFNRRAAEVAG
jgi:hypothetical protein